MKHLCLLSLLSLLPALTAAQCDCACMFDEANKAFERKDYPRAIKRYNAARKCNPADERRVNKKIDEVFDKIMSLAEDARREQAAAEAARAAAVFNAEMAENAENEAQQSDRIARNAVQAVKVARTDPVIGLRMAEFIIKKYPHAWVAPAMFNEIFIRTEQFYKTRFSLFSGITAHLVTFSPDGRRLLIAGQGGKVGLFSLKGEELRRYKNIGQQVSVASFMDEGRRILVCDYYEGAKVLDTTGHVVHGFPNAKTAAVAPDGKHFAVMYHDGNIVVYASHDTLPVVGPPLETRRSTASNISKIALSSDLNYIATVLDVSISSMPSNAPVHKVVWIWSSGKMKARLEGHEDAITSVSFSFGGGLLLTSSKDNTSGLWDVDGNVLAVFSGHTNDVYWATFSKDDKFVFTASEDRTLRQWDLEGRHMSTFSGHTRTVRAVACSPSDKLVASVDGAPATDGSTCLIWQVNSLSPQRNQQDSSRTFKQSPRFLEQQVSNSKTFKHLQKFPETLGTGNPDFLYSLGHDGKTVVVCHRDMVRIADLYGSRAKDLTFRANNDNPTSIALSPDRKTAITGYRNGIMIRWNLGHDTATIADSLKQHTALISSISFSKDGKTFVSASWDKTACLWEKRSTKPTAILIGHSDRVECVALSPDGRMLTGSRDGTAKLWSKEGKELRNIAAHTRKISSVAFAPDGKTFATGSWDKTAKIWNAEDAGKSVSLEGHLEEITSLAFDHKGQRLLTGSIDNSLRKWTLEGEEVIKLIGHPTDVAALAYSGDSLIISGDRRGQVISWYTIDHFIREQVADVSVLDMVKLDLELSKEEILAEQDAELLTYSAALQEKKQQWEEADELYSEAHRLKPSHSTILGLYRTAEKLNRPFDFQRIPKEDAGLQAQFGEELFSQKKHLKEASQMLEHAYKVAPNRETLKLLDQIAAYEKKNFDFNRFLSVQKAEDLEYYGYYFYQERGMLKEAAQLFKKAEETEHMARRLTAWHNADPDGPEFDRFMASDSLQELSEYASYFYGRSKWDWAWMLYEKSLNKAYSGYTLLQMQRVASRAGRPSPDFQKFLKSERPSELEEFVHYFRQEATRNAPPKAASDSVLVAQKDRWEKVRQLSERLYNLRPSYHTLNTWYEASEKTGASLEFSRFLRSENPQDLSEHGRFFYERGQWDKALQLYQKSDSMHRSTASLSGLYLVARASGLDKKTDQLHKSGSNKETDQYFQEMLRSENPDELLEYAGAVRPTADMTWQKVPLDSAYQYAKHLEEKAFKLAPLEAVRHKKDLSTAYNSLGWHQLFIPDSIGTGPRGCELSILRGIALDPSNLYLYTNLPTAYLLQGKWEDAKKIYLERRDQPYMPNRNLPFFRDIFIQDINELERRSITHPDFNCVRQLMGKPLPDKPCKRL